MPAEQSTLIVSVHVDDSDEARIQTIQAQVGDGWRVLQAIPLSGGGLGPGGESEGFLRMQVTVEREVGPDGQPVGGERPSVADLKSEPATALFDPPFKGEDA